MRQVIDLYKKEREYEKKTFGNYSDIESLSFPSFIILIRTYLEKIEKAYSGKWSKELPPWLLNCDEFEKGGAAPIKAYEELVKLMTLAGAALESYTQLDVERWREDPDIDREKWIDK